MFRYDTLMLVTQKKQTTVADYVNFIKTCVDAGVTCVQLREKELNQHELITLGTLLLEVLKPMSVPLIINDHLDVALRLNADGVHLGQSDGDVITARKKLGEHKIIGLTVNSLADIEIANTLPVDYIGVGAIFPTDNKPNVKHHWGLAELKQAVNLSQHKVVAIGGINQDNVAAVLDTGTQGIAAIGAFHAAKKPADVVKFFLNQITPR